MKVKTSNVKDVVINQEIKGIEYFGLKKRKFWHAKQLQCTSLTTKIMDEEYFT